jgi:hypothetical protein
MTTTNWFGKTAFVQFSTEHLSPTFRLGLCIVRCGQSRPVTGTFPCNECHQKSSLGANAAEVTIKVGSLI